MTDFPYVSTSLDSALSLEILRKQFVEQVISLFIDLWKREPTVPEYADNETMRVFYYEKLYYLLAYDVYLTNFSVRPSYFDANVSLMIINLNNSIQTYLDSQINFIIAKYCFNKKANSYNKNNLEIELNNFVSFINSRRNIEHSTKWIELFVASKDNYMNQLDRLINNRYEEICSKLLMYNSFDSVDDLFLFLSGNNNSVNSLNYVYATSLGSDPFNSDDEALVFKAEDIISDNTRFLNKTESSYCVLNGLKKVTNLRTTSFYNFYTLDECISGEGDVVANSENYYDIASAYKFMPRYIKLTWNPIIGGSGIDTKIIPVSGNISNISDLPILNEFYFSQTFRKDSNVISSVSPTVFSQHEETISYYSPTVTTERESVSSYSPGTIYVMPRDSYVTICSSSMYKFINSEFWRKIIYDFINRDTKDVIDNLVFIRNNNLLRRRSDEQPKLQYVGYLINKYEFNNGSWKLKEIIMLDDCKTSCYYDFNVLYNRRYKYKMSTLIKWVYSTSLLEVESFYSLAESIDSGSISTDVSLPDSTSTEILPSVIETGIGVAGSFDSFMFRNEKIIGESIRESEESGETERNLLERVCELRSKETIDTFRRK